MTEPNKSTNCQLGCWAMGALAGLVFFAVFKFAYDWGFLQAAFMGLVIFAIVGLLLSWILCKPLPQHGSAEAPTAAKPASSSQSTAAAAPTPAPAPPSKPTPEPVAEAPAPAPEPAAPTAADEGPAVKPSTPLAGQAELAERKGTWKYEGDAGTDSAPAAAPAPAAEATPAAASGEARRPAALESAREGGADDLKRIKGVGPKMEQLLNSLGFYHFDQIAAWTADEVAWVDDNLQGFKGRVSRDNWVAQAATLASGAETEFSKRVDDGDVY